MQKLFYILTLQYLLFWLPNNNCLSYQKYKPKRYSDKKYTQSIKTNTFGHFFGFHEIAYDYGMFFFELRMFKLNSWNSNLRSMISPLRIYLIDSFSDTFYNSTIGLKYQYKKLPNGFSYWFGGVTFEKGENDSRYNKVGTYSGIAPTIGYIKQSIAKKFVIENYIFVGYLFFMNNSLDRFPIYLNTGLNFGILF